MSNHKTKVMIVEDETIFALFMKHRLNRLGFEVTATVSNYESAIKAIELNLPDLTLMDISIKGSINGIETAKRLREIYNIPSLFITADIDDKTKEEVSKTFPIGFLSKPLDEFEFEKILRHFQSTH